MPLYRCPSYDTDTDTDTDTDAISLLIEEDDDDYPHPIGFSRYGLLDVRSSNDDAKESIVYDNNDDELLWNHDENQNSGPSGYCYRENRTIRAYDLVENSRLLQHSLQLELQRKLREEEEVVEVVKELTCDMDRIAALVRCAVDADVVVVVVDGIESNECKGDDMSVFDRSKGQLLVGLSFSGWNVHVYVVNVCHTCMELANLVCWQACRQ